MGELSVRRNRGFAVPRYQGIGKAEKQAGTSRLQPAANRAAATVSETLRQLMTRVSQAERHIREGRRTLQTGEASLAEVDDSLGRMEELALKAAGDGAVDRAALQAELEQLRGEIDRIAQAGVEAGLFQDGEAGDGLDAMVDAIMDGLSAQEDGAQGLPSWLTLSIFGNAPDRALLRAVLGVDLTAAGAELLAALGQFQLGDNFAVDYLAAYYLGLVIAGGSPSGELDSSVAAAGLRQLLEAVAEGLSPDQAIEMLTGGMFTSLEDFETQFLEGTAPGLEDFLMEFLILSEGNILAGSYMLALSDWGGEEPLDLLLNLLSVLDRAGSGTAELSGAERPEGSQQGAPPQMETLELGTVQAAGRDLSGVAFDPETGELLVDGTEHVILRGLGQEAPVIRISGSGTVTLQQVDTPLLIVESAQVRVCSVGENALAQVWLGEGTALTLDGRGQLYIGGLQGGVSSVLRLTGGVVELAGGAEELAPEEAEALAARVVVDGPVSLLAARGTVVYNAQGKPLEPFDLVWKTLFPEWSSITSAAVDGRQGQLALRADGRPDLVRLWLLKGDSSQGYPAHTIIFHGRDRAGHLRTRYVYVRWDQREEGFQEISMYPNPFTVTGGEPDVDWRYEEESHTLHILTGQVNAIAGGAGTDANQLPFSGRIALADGVGQVELILDGVECRVSSGRAFSLGCGNDVTLLLRRGTENVFESGEGFAGISLGDGTSLRIDQAKGGRGLPDGKLAATGGPGGAGIGRDRAAGKGRTGSILIRGGAVTAAGAGGGAGIGGAPGAPVGDIRIQGGTVTAQAGCCAAAIGAGIQGACGDIVITGSARVVKAQGGGPDGDIGGCLFGNCGKVQVSAGTDIGGAKVWSQQGLSLPMGETTVTLPRFRISVRALHLDGLNLTTRELARTTMEILAADRRWITRLQGAYGAMYGQLEQNFSGLRGGQPYAGVVRDTDEAGELLLDMREVLRQSPFAAFLSQQEIEHIGQLLR